MTQYYVYILSNKRNGTLYIGATNNLKSRLENHKTGAVTGFSKRYSLNKLVYYEVLEDFYESRQREKQLKAWRREWKLKLIETKNPDWNDLSNGL